MDQSPVSSSRARPPPPPQLPVHICSLSSWRRLLGAVDPAALHLLNHRCLGRGPDGEARMGRKLDGEAPRSPVRPWLA